MNEMIFCVPFVAMSTTSHTHTKSQLSKERVCCGVAAVWCYKFFSIMGSLSLLAEYGGVHALAICTFFRVMHDNGTKTQIRLACFSASFFRARFLTTHTHTLARRTHQAAPPVLSRRE